MCVNFFSHNHKTKGRISHFTSTLTVTPCENNACSVLASQGYLHTSNVCMSPRECDQLGAKDAEVEKALLSCDVTIKVLVK